MFSTPLPQFGFSVQIVSLPKEWMNLADPTQWEAAKQKLFERIGVLCQHHIRMIMMGQEPNSKGDLVPFLDSKGTSRDSVQYKVESSAVEIFVDDRASYLTYQEYGVSTQPMKWMVGKTVPYVLVSGRRVNPSSGRVVEGVTRFKWAGPGSRFAGGAQGSISNTKMVSKEAIDKKVHFSAITEATFSQPSKYNPTGLKWWHPGYSGKHFFRDGVMAGMKEVAGHVAGMSFQVSGANWAPELLPMTNEYQEYLDNIESTLTYEQKSPYPVNVTINR